MSALQTAQAVTSDELRRMDEPAIDTLIEAVYNERWERTERLNREWARLYRAAGVRQERLGVYPLTRDELVQRVKQGLRAGEDPANPVAQAVKADGGSPIRWYDALVTAYRGLLTARTRLAELEAAELTLDAEFWRRGGWNRAYLAQSHDGHVHRSQSCKTCHKGEQPTRFVWMTEYSGASEADIVKAAGARACTVCYPYPSVEDLRRPSQMHSPEEVARAKAAEDRAKKKAEKQAKAAAAAITLPDGSPLRDELRKDDTQGGSVVRTLRAAKIELNSEALSEASWGDRHGTHARNMLHLARAIAWREAGRPQTSLKAAAALLAEPPLSEAVEELLAKARTKAAKELARYRAAG